MRANLNVMCASFRLSAGTRNRRKARGFTLTELMVVVALVGILSTVGIVAFRRQVASSKTTEATSVVRAISAAEIAYRGENQVYLNVSSSNDDWYPSADIGKAYRSWEVKSGGHPDLVKWQTLGVQVTQPVQFGYLVNSGNAGATLPTLQVSSPPSLGTPNDAWYLIQGRGNFDGDMIYCNVVAASWTPEVYIENEGE